jgi:hypothetical protein
VNFGIQHKGKLMTATKVTHTPGPWVFNESDDGHEIRMGDAIKSRAMHDCQNLIEYNHGLFYYDDMTPPQLEQYQQAEANAKLIAASPNLLAICEKLQQKLESDWDGFGKDSREYLLLEELEKAINKATA